MIQGPALFILHNVTIENLIGNANIGLSSVVQSQTKGVNCSRVFEWNRFINECSMPYLVTFYWVAECGLACLLNQFFSWVIVLSLCLSSTLVYQVAFLTLWPDASVRKGLALQIEGMQRALEHPCNPFVNSMMGQIENRQTFDKYCQCFEMGSYGFAASKPLCRTNPKQHTWIGLWVTKHNVMWCLHDEGLDRFQYGFWVMSPEMGWGGCLDAHSWSSILSPRYLSSIYPHFSLPTHPTTSTPLPTSYHTTHWWQVSDAEF